MKILILNSILFTPEKDVIPPKKSIKDTMIYSLCLGFLKLGHKVTLAAASEYRPIEDETYEFEIKFFHSNYTKFCKPSVLPYSKELKRFLQKQSQEFDIVISSEVFSFPSLFAAMYCPEKTIIWHELALHQKKFHKIPSRLWYTIIAPIYQGKVRCIVPRSIRAKEFLSKYMRNVTENYVEHGINVEQFTPSLQKEKYMVYIGQFIERKNIPCILNKFSRYKKKHNNGLQLLLIGEGPMKEQINNLVTELNLSADVKILGFMNHKALNEVLRKAKCMLIDTKQDNNMVSIPESIVCGTPVLSNSIPTNAYTIKQNKLGIVKDNWDETDIEEIIDHNTKYVENCIRYRENLTNIHSAQLFIDIIN